MRALRILLVLAVVLGGILVGVDRLAVAYAESEAADQVKLSGARSEAITVDIKGFPFLTQFAAERLDRVDVRATGIMAQAGDRKIRVGELDLALRDVTMNGDWTATRAGSASGTALLSYADLTAAASEQGAAVAYGGDGRVKVTGGVTILGRTLTRTVFSTVTAVNGDTIRFRADKVPGEGIPGLEDLVRARTDFERPLHLVAGMRVEKVEPRPEGLVVTVSGKDIALAG